MKHIELFIVIVMLNIAIANSQILEITPALSTANDYVTIIYDAIQGNGALKNVSPVYPEVTGFLAAFFRPSDNLIIAGVGNEI